MRGKYIMEELQPNDFIHKLNNLTIILSILFPIYERKAIEHIDSAASGLRAKDGAYITFTYFGERQNAC